jgi:phosphoribosylglycinamide formyltransferase-1
MDEKIAVFVSGKGSNARKIQEFFEFNLLIHVVLILSEKQNPSLERWCLEKGVRFSLIEQGQGSDTEHLHAHCSALGVQWIVLAGYLKKIPEGLIELYPDRIINLHPALLPKYGGKGMYGDYVHQAVLAANERQSGITIHLVNKEYDKGEILAQIKINLDNLESLESLRTKIQLLEHLHFSQVIYDYIIKKTTVLDEETTF